MDISSKGKVRARKVNYMHASEVKQVNYPLRFKAKAQLKYFQTRETWRVTDFLFNPMILMMVVPLLLLLVLPKMINTNDAETQKVRHPTPTLTIPFSNMLSLAHTTTRSCKIFPRWTCRICRICRRCSPTSLVVVPNHSRHQQRAEGQRQSRRNEDTFEHIVYSIIMIGFSKIIVCVKLV